jgi:hypothetical protein
MFRKCEARLQQFGTEPSVSEADEKVKRNVQVGQLAASGVVAIGHWHPDAKVKQALTASDCWLLCACLV